MLTHLSWDERSADNRPRQRRLRAQHRRGVRRKDESEDDEEDDEEDGEDDGEEEDGDDEEGDLDELEELIELLTELCGSNQPNDLGIDPDMACGILELIEEERQDFTDRLDQEQAESNLGHPGGAFFVLLALFGAALSSRAQRPRA